MANLDAAMTRKERTLKQKLVQHLKEQGYATLGQIFDECFIFNLTDDENTIAYTSFAAATIVMNRNLNVEYASTVLRHELFHQILNHEMRLIKHVAKKFNLDVNKLSDKNLLRLKNLIYRDKLFNIAGDMEISNKAYSEKDKNIARGMFIWGRLVTCIVTEDNHPDWVDLSLEEIYDKLVDEQYEANKAAAQQIENEVKKAADEDIPDWNEDDVSDDITFGRKDDFVGGGEDQTEYINGYFNEEDGRFYDEDGNLLNADDFIEED